jgi:hypothetical protein
VAALRAMHAETGLTAAADWAGVLANRLADTPLPKRDAFSMAGTASGGRSALSRLYRIRQAILAGVTV